MAPEQEGNFIGSASACANGVSVAAKTQVPRGHLGSFKIQTVRGIKTAVRRRGEREDENGAV
jgi:hypothetical protein